MHQTDSFHRDPRIGWTPPQPGPGDAEVDDGARADANPSASTVDGVTVAMDVGGTLIKSALIAADGTPSGVAITDTGCGDGPRAVVARVLSEAERRCEEAERLRGHAPAAVGVAVPGIVDEATGSAVYSANLDWRDLPLADLLRRRLRVPVAVRHDVRAGAVAEARMGAARGVGLCAFLPVGTGVGGAVIADGWVLSGAHWRAGELGHLVIDPSGPPCACGARGCVETYASAPAIARAYADRSGEAGADSAAVAGLVAVGDLIASFVWGEAVDALARGILAMSAVLDPERVIIGGGLSRAGNVLLEPLRAAVARHAAVQVPPELVTAAFTDEAAYRGAGLAAWDLPREDWPPVRTSADNRA